MAPKAMKENSSSSSSSSSSSQQWKYDVFLSFRGEDTRKNFISHLCKEFRQKGIIIFKDDRELEKGETISQELLKAVESSKISLVIFSKNYASSTWCLDELVKILECKNSGNQIVLPIFYDVNPSEVRKQNGSFENDFEHYQQNDERVQRWRLAMTQVANLSGWNLQGREESEFIQDITKDVLNKLERFSHSIAKDFVGMNSRLEKMRLCINIKELNNVKTVGICGMGGIGKTTIASVTYKEMQCQFEGSAFLADVRETSRKYGLFTLQRRLLCATLMERDIDVYDVYNGVYHIKNRLSRKKVLVILDDVDELEQLELLVGKKDENWFGVGSRIIITTRDEHLLIQHEVDQIYRVEELNHHEALQLFCLKAFKKDCPPQDYMELSNKAVNYAGGLPLALNVLGSSLCARSMKEWNSALKRLKEIPNEKILSKLEISFDGLEEIQKKIFLDIACFFKGKMKRYVMKVLESGGLCPDIGIRELIDKSLITISDNRVWMHDFLEEMGQEIVHRECREEPGRRSRLWLYKDVCHVLMNDTGTNLIEGVVLDYIFDQGDRYMSSKAFLKMKALRLLILRNLNLSKDIE